MGIMARLQKAKERTVQRRTDKFCEGLPAYPFPLTPNQYRPDSEPRLQKRFPQKDIYSPAQTSATNERLMSRLAPQSRRYSETTISRFQTERLSNSEPPVNPFRTNPPLTTPPQTDQQRHPSSTIPRMHACVLLKYVVPCSVDSQEYLFPSPPLPHHYASSVGHNPLVCHLCHCCFFSSFHLFSSLSVLFFSVSPQIPRMCGLITYNR